MRNHVKSTAAALAVVMAVFAAMPAVAAARQGGGGGGAPLTQPVTGTFTDALGGTGTFEGTYTVQRFTSQNGQLAVVGTLTGTLTNSVGNVIDSVTQQVTMPVTQADGTCQILHLELGPLDLDLLGLVVHLDQVVLDITAQSGPGNLLGNLLCAIAGLLDSNAPLSGLVNALNNLLNLLR
jgi:hypothetical protein